MVADQQEQEVKMIPEVILNSSSGKPRMPVIGMGMAAEPLDEAAMKWAALEAIKLGYRVFDTATLYKSERPLGEAIAEAVKLGLVASRQEIFVISKLWITNAHPHLVIPSLQNSLRYTS